MKKKRKKKQKEKIKKKVEKYNKMKLLVKITNRLF